MAIRTVVTRGFANGTFNGTIPLVVTRGYAIGAAVVDVVQVYTANLYCNISPTRNLKANPTPARNLKANPTPTKEVYNG